VLEKVVTPTMGDEEVLVKKSAGLVGVIRSIERTEHPDSGNPDLSGRIQTGPQK